MIERSHFATIQSMAFRTTGSNGCNEGLQSPRVRNESFENAPPQHKKFEIRQLLPHRCSVMIYYVWQSSLSLSVPPMTGIGRKERPRALVANGKQNSIQATPMYLREQGLPSLSV